MTTPTLYLPFEGSLGGQTQDGAYTPTSTGDVSFAAGLVPGTQAYVPKVTPASYVTADASRISSARGTLAVRARFASVGAGTQQYAVAANDGGIQRLYIHRLNGVVQASVNDLGNLVGPALADDTWATVILDWNAGTARLWVNGALAATTSYTTPLNQMTVLRIGASPSGATLMNGRIDEVMVFDEVLTEAERSALFDTNRKWSFDILRSSPPRRILTPGPRPITMLTPH